MASLYVLNNLIYSSQLSINSMNQQLEQKRAELERLKTALSELNACKSDFHQNKKLCLEPELTFTTWHGQLANNFDSYRKGELQSSYLLLPDKQLREAITRLKSEIQSVEQTIQGLKGDISSQKSRLSDLKDQRRRELAKRE